MAVNVKFNLNLFVTFRGEIWCLIGQTLFFNGVLFTYVTQMKHSNDNGNNNNNINNIIILPKTSLSLRHRESCLDHYYCFVFRKTRIRISTLLLASLTAGFRGFSQSFKQVWTSYLNFGHCHFLFSPKIIFGSLPKKICNWLNLGFQLRLPFFWTSFFPYFPLESLSWTCIYGVHLKCFDRLPYWVLHIHTSPYTRR